MPIENDEILKQLLARGRISAMSLDTNVFDAQHLNLDSTIFRAIANLKSIPFDFVLSHVVASEVKKHIEKSMREALAAFNKSSRAALLAFGTNKTTRDALSNVITDGRSIPDAARMKFDSFASKSACKILNDYDSVHLSSIYRAYFEQVPPFRQGKKTEFPDALALFALENEAKRLGTGFLVISEDTDWREFCQESTNLFLVPKVEKALSLLADAPIRLRKEITSWLSDPNLGRLEIESQISRDIEQMDIDVVAYTLSGGIAAQAWAPEVLSIEWPEESEVDIIETKMCDNGRQKAVVSVPVHVLIRYIAEVNLTVWDSIDRESLDLGGRTIEKDSREYARITVALSIPDSNRSGEKITLIRMEFDPDFASVDFGELHLLGRYGHHDE